MSGLEMAVQHPVIAGFVIIALTISAGIVTLKTKVSP